jgi:hypothetical protein
MNTPRRAARTVDLRPGSAPLLMVVLLLVMAGSSVASSSRQGGDLEFALRTISERLLNALPRDRPVRIAVLPFAEPDLVFARPRRDLSEHLGSLLTNATRGERQIEIVTTTAIDHAARDLGLVQPVGPSAAPLIGISVYADYVVVGTLTPSVPGLAGDIRAELIDVTRRRGIRTASVELIASAPSDATTVRSNVHHP